MQAIVVAPTLELSAQICRVLNTLEPGAAAAITDDTAALPQSAVVVGPPARLLALLSEGGAAAAAATSRPRFRDAPVDEEAFDDGLEAAMQAAPPTRRLERGLVAGLLSSPVALTVSGD